MAGKRNASVDQGANPDEMKIFKQVKKPQREGVQGVRRKPISIVEPSTRSLGLSLQLLALREIWGKMIAAPP